MLVSLDIFRYLINMAKRPAQETEGALYVKLPVEAVDKLDRAAEALGVRKKDLVAGLVTRYVDPDTRHGLHALGALSGPRRVSIDVGDGSPTLGSYSFQAYDPLPPPEVMTVAETAELLKTDEHTVLQLAEAGDIPARKLGKTWRFSRTAVLGWLAGG